MEKASSVQFSHSVVADSLRPVDCSPPGSSIHGIHQSRILEWVAISFTGDLPDPGIEPRSAALQADALTSKPPGKPLDHQKSMRIPEKTFISALLTMPKPLTVWITINCGKFFKRYNTRPPNLPPEKSVCRSRSNS